MADTTFERSRGTGGGTQPTLGPESRQHETSRPPQSLWRLYLLSVTTLGLWLCYWACSFAEDLRRNGKTTRFEPWVYMVGLPVPIFGSPLIQELAEATHALSNPRAEDGDRFSNLVTISGGVAVFFYVATITCLVVCGVAPYTVFQALSLLLLLPLPFLALQGRFNRVKTNPKTALWTETPNRFHGDEKVMIAVMLVLMLLLAGVLLQGRIGPWQAPGSLGRWSGEALAASEPVSGESGLYTLTPPDGDWLRVGRDRFYEGTDLSLLGPGADTRVFVWVKCNGDNIEDRVRFRRGKWDGADGRVGFAERRQLLERPFVPISYVHYEAIWRGTPSLSFVATIAQGDVLVEVIGEAHPESDHRGSMEALVRSLQLDEEATSCGGS